jgi:hypothetical protein
MKVSARALALTAVLAALAAAAPAGAWDGMRADASGAPARAAANGPPLLVLPPLVRLAGTPTSRGARIRLLEVFAPPQATVTVRCRGRTCPYRIRSTRATAIRVTFRGFRRRRLAAGTLVEVFIAAPGTIGKYTAFLIRRRRRPARVDHCLQPAAVVPSACPRGG